MKRIPTYLDRYPGKMVSHLARRLLDRYMDVPTGSANLSVLDPFCGSGSLVVSAAQRGFGVSGLDLSPYAVLLTRVKLGGFDPHLASALASRLVAEAKSGRKSMSMQWPLKSYWFSSQPLRDIERLRAAAVRLNLNASREGRAVLLAMALSMRLCSRADQRSPKPFISRVARETRITGSYDPFATVVRLVEELCELYGGIRLSVPRVYTADIRSTRVLELDIGVHSHIITSPPYINAQDYFRNSKFELYLLEGIVPFRVRDIQDVFVGTERGRLLRDIPPAFSEECFKLVPELHSVALAAPRLAMVVQRYLFDMLLSFMHASRFLATDGTLVVVCGDNLVSGVRIRTWSVLHSMLRSLGFSLQDSFCDRIRNRSVPPNRKGHKGLIKEEVVCAYKRILVAPCSHGGNAV